MRQAIIYPGEDEYSVAECPSLPGCISQGKTREEAISNIREAIEGYIAALEQDHLPVPLKSLRRFWSRYKQPASNFRTDLRKSVSSSLIHHFAAAWEPHDTSPPGTFHADRCPRPS